MNGGRHYGHAGSLCIQEPKAEGFQVSGQPELHVRPVSKQNHTHMLLLPDHRKLGSRGVGVGLFTEGRGQIEASHMIFTDSFYFVRMHVGTHVSGCTCRNQRTFLRDGFSLFTLQVP